MKITPEQKQGLISTLQARFERHMDRHVGLNWVDVLEKLEANPEKLWSLYEMERTGGEPDVVGRDEKTGAVLFFDCSAESPEGRRNLCYDQAALEARKKNKPAGSAMGMAAAMGIAMLTEAEYRQLQELGAFDTKTSSWVETPPNIRALGGAMYGDRRFGAIWFYHNGADSYYAVRGFRGSLRV